VRLIDEKGEIISPFFFLDIAKKYRLYEYVTQIMIERTFDYFRDKHYDFSINLSIEDILDEHMVAFIIGKIKQFHEPHRIVFEITETEGIENYLEVELFLRDIKEFGCKVAIDDFGTGYSNFEYIIKLNIDYLKIDGSLIKNIANNRESRVVVETILLFAQKLGIETITEFVSTKESFEIMQELKADYIQGYFIGEPEKVVRSEMN
jgi:EAL domain-containing protein (putative c-di-GMP-specific phosphodiesterase class I)